MTFTAFFTVFVAEEGIRFHKEQSIFVGVDPPNFRFYNVCLDHSIQKKQHMELLSFYVLKSKRPD